MVRLSPLAGVQEEEPRRIAFNTVELSAHVLTKAFSSTERKFALSVARDLRA